MAQQLSNNGLSDSEVGAPVDCNRRHNDGTGLYEGIEMSNELGPIFERLGELSGTLKGVDSNLNEIKEDHTAIREKLGDVEKHVASLNSVEKKLGHLGIDYTQAQEFRDLMDWARKKRVSEKDRNQVIFRTLLTAVVLATCATLSSYFWTGFKADVNVNNQPVHKSPEDGNIRGTVPRP